jgi:hypothetical protein
VQRARFANRLFWPTRTYQVCTLGHSRSRAPELAEELSTPGRTESSNYVRVCMQPLAFAVCSWAAAWRATGCSPPCVLTLRLPPVCLLTDSPPVPGSGGRSSHHHTGFAGIPFAVSGPICSPRDGQTKQSHLHSCPFCMRQRPAELSANRERDRQYDDSLSSPHYG